MKPVLANLGFILQINGLLTVIPVMIAFYFNESPALESFFVTVVVCLIAGFLLNALCERKELDFRYSCMLLTITYLLVGLVGCIPYVYLNIFATEDPVSLFTNAYFESISGYTTTGFSVIADVDVLPKSILFYRSMTQWIGGIGIIFILLAFFYPSEEITHFIKTVGIERIGRSLKTLLAFILLVYTVYLTIFTLVLCFTFIADPVKAVSLVFSSLTTGGFSPLKDPSKLADYQVGFILVILMIAGALNFRTHYWVLNRQFRRAFTKEFRLFLVIITLAAIAMYWLTGLDPYNVLFHTVSASSTTGFQFIDLARLGINAKLVLILLMLIGGCTFSTAGGIKVLRLIIFLKAIPWLVKRAVSKKVEPFKLEGTIMGDIDVLFSLTIPVLALALVSISVPIFYLNGYSLIDSLFEVTSAFATAGLSAGIVSISLPLGLKWLLVILMVLGRIEVVPLLITLGLRIRRPHRWA